MDKRYFSLLNLSFLFCIFFSFTLIAQAREIALTFDDAPTPDSVLMTGLSEPKKLSML
ncbi:hypothetical protein [Cellvibrio sp. NN19]|uniref:hypothetical protein n=1 Tax=Cellvibrio chitinivorans TaxID=3102792 RepID=UPI002B40FB18|nr:hypothetical protein [Cellvibrio sp. NN19]